MASLEDRVCEVHGLTVHRGYRDNRRVDYVFWKCGKCEAEDQRKRRRSNKVRAIKYKGSSCSRCGLEDKENPEIYDFHHTDPTQKEFKPSMLRKSSWEKHKAELDKCILLCSNCHRIVHKEEGYV